MALVLCSFALTACTPMEWRRDGEVATLESKEYLRCRNQSLLDGMRLAPFSGMSSYPIIGRDPLGRPFVVYRPWSHTDQMMREQLSMNQCMARLGFQLLPVAPAAKQSP